MSIIALLISLVVYGLIFYCLWWSLGKIGLPEPFNKIATVVLVLATIIVLIGLLMGNIQPIPFAYYQRIK